MSYTFRSLRILTVKQTVMIWSYWEKENLCRDFLIVCLDMFCLCNPIIKKRRNPINRLTPSQCCAYLKPVSVIPNAICRVFFYVQWVEVRGRCLFYRYWWNWLPSLLEKCCEFESHSGEVYSTTLCEKVCQWLAEYPCFFRVLRFHLPKKLTAAI